MPKDVQVGKKICTVLRQAKGLEATPATPNFNLGSWSAIHPATGASAPLLPYSMLAVITCNDPFIFYRNVYVACNLACFILSWVLRLLWTVILGVFRPLRFLQFIFRQ